MHCNYVLIAFLCIMSSCLVWRPHANIPYFKCGKTRRLYNMRNIFNGSNFFRLCIMPIVRAILFVTCITSLFQVRCLLIVIPKNVNVSTNRECALN